MRSTLFVISHVLQSVASDIGLCYDLRALDSLHYDLYYVTYMCYRWIHIFLMIVFSTCMSLMHWGLI